MRLARSCVFYVLAQNNRFSQGDLFASLLKISSAGRRPLNADRNSAPSGGRGENGGEKSARSGDQSRVEGASEKAAAVASAASEKSASDNLVVSKAENAAFEDLFEQLCNGGDAGSASPKLEEINFGAGTLASREARLRQKRQRNQTIDLHELSPRAWNGHVACPVNPIDWEQQVGDGEEGLGQGLEIILDKLKNIENKLDEIKELEEHNICVATTGHTSEDALKFPGMLPELGATPSTSESSLQLLTHLTSDGDLGRRLKRPPESEAGFLVDRACNTSLIRDGSGSRPSSLADSNDCDDVTLMADNEDRTDTDCDDIGVSEAADGKTGMVFTPSTPTQGQPSASKLEVESVRSMSEGEGDEIRSEEERQRRIETLAQQIMDEKKKLAELEEIEARDKTGQFVLGAVEGEIVQAAYVIIATGILPF